MIIDTSAIMAMLRDEPESTPFLKILIAHDRWMMSAGSWLELAAVTIRSGDSGLPSRSDEFIANFGIKIAPVTIEQAQIAREAYRQYGRGTRHPADLNFGDCFAYALAKATGEPLLFKGGDFAQTDVARAFPA